VRAIFTDGSATGCKNDSEADRGGGAVGFA